MNKLSLILHGKPSVLLKSSALQGILILADLQYNEGYKCDQLSVQMINERYVSCIYRGAENHDLNFFTLCFFDI